MKAICAWCKKEIGHRDSPPGSEDAITHGICEDCAHHLFAEFGMPLRDYLDGLPFPVLVLDHTGAVKSGNRKARTLLNRDFPVLDNPQPGIVFECVHALHQDGCGRTVHCSGCVLRKTITETFRTGKSLFRVPASIRSDDQGTTTELTISTEKTGNLVLLRIDVLGNKPPREQS
jgi:hypothetical protein